MAKRNYVLESKNEFQRLEKQSATTHYDFREELSGLTVNPGMRVLDAGTGSGIVARYLAAEHPSTTVVGVDASADRVTQAQQASKGLQNLSFKCVDLTREPVAGAAFDVIICRYVLQHMKSGEIYKQALRNLFQSTKAGGTICVIETDGLFMGLSHLTESLRNALLKIDENEIVELNMGRRVPSLLAEAGFLDVHCRAEARLFQGRDLAAEKEMMLQRFQQGQALLKGALGSAQAGEQFQREYVASMEAEQALYFHTKFIVTATKPAISPVLRLVTE